MKSQMLETAKTLPVITLTNHQVSLYYSIYELPMHIFSEFQSYLIQDLGIGTTIADLNNRYEQLDICLAAGKIKDAIQERYNLHMGLYYGLNQITIKHYAFACLVHSIDGEVCSDHSEEGLKSTIKRLSDINVTESLVRAYLNEVKKNSIQN